ncbi:MAG: NADH-quinone oxidoreductase subunit L [Rubricoccaceae bacterium]|nr:NADH-quinone oxidoreductase subunit L [Rubricoccaceae bacterium]
MELLVRLILLPPLLVAAFNGMMGLFAPGYRQREWLIGGLATAAVALPFAVTVSIFLGFHHEAEVVRYFTWLAAGDLQVDFAYRIDQLSLLMTLIVTGVGALIHLYSIGYMHKDPGYWRFFAYLNLFIFAMLNLVLAENLVVLFLGWEGVGLCSYLLIGFWYTDLKNSAAANKAFIVNRIGDFAFLVALFVIFAVVTDGREGVFGFDFTTLLAPETLALFGGGTTLLVVLLFFVGATGKSAQIPLFVWLPDAMAGPTPVSALIHAATMVTSGLYLLARLSPMVLQAPTAMATIAIVGALTALMAATIAITQNDIKKVLAYSTVSQLGFMFMAAGVGAFFVSIFHVMTHAFFKGCLFLGSGSVIHSMHHVEHELEHKGLIPPHHGPGAHDTPLDSEATQDPLRTNPLPYDGPFDAQDMRTMGGLRTFMPWTAGTFLVSTLAIAGLPPLAGFFSKDEILFKAFEFGLNDHAWAYLVWIVGIATALLTAVYMGRCYLLTFEGRPRWPDALDTKPHESPWTMTVPLVVLAVLSAVGGFLGLPAVLGESWIHHWLGAEYGGPVAEPVHELHVAHSTEWGLLGLGALIAVGGLFLAYVRWGRRGLDADASLRRRLGGVYRLWAGKYFVDELYDGAVVNPVVEGSRRGLAPFDQKGVDGAVNGLARSVAGLAGRLRGIQTGVVQTYALYVVLGVALVLGLMLFV